MSDKRSPKPAWKYVDVAIVDGVAVLPDGRSIMMDDPTSKAKVLRWPVLTKAGRKRMGRA